MMNLALYLEPIKKRSFVIFAVLAILPFSLPQSFAAEEKTDDRWEFEVAPYVWAMALNGDVTVKGRKIDLDLSFSDIWDELNGAVMLTFSGRKGKWGFFGDTIYANLGEDRKIGQIKLKPDINTLWVTLGGFYRAGSWPLSAAPNKTPTVTMDILAAARYTYLDVDLDFSPQVVPNVGGSKDWVDPLVGVRAFFDLSDRWTCALVGTVGGFGVGSDLTWDANGTFGYRFSLFSQRRNARVVAGYRALYQDYHTGSGSNRFEWDVTMHGPILGLAVTF